MEENGILYETRTYTITGLKRILGSQPADPDVRSKFIASKAATLRKGEAENEHLPDPEELSTTNLTVFLRDHGHLCVCDYIIKGFLKEAFGNIKHYDSIQLASASSKIDNLITIGPEYLTFTRDGKPIDQPDSVFERPLRAMTMQGPRTTVTASEVIEAGWELTFDVTLLDNKGTQKSKPLTFQGVELALANGRFRGLGQWRNAMNGQFTTRRIK